MSLLRSSHLQHSALNIAGAVVPMAVAIPSLGVLARELTNSDFSVLLLIWAFIGYAGILDLGLSRAIVVETVALRQDPAARGTMFVTVFALAILAGLIGAVLIGIGADWLTRAVFRIEGEASLHVAQSVAASGWALPFLLPYLMTQGYLDGLEAFVEANLQRALSGAIPLALAAGVAVVTGSLSAAVWGIVAGRAVSLLVAICRNDHFRLLRQGTIQPSILLPLLGYGGWVSLSGIISPLMGYLDRFILSFARGPEVVGFYAAPAEAIYKLLVIPVAIARSLFPKIAANKKNHNSTDLFHSYLLIGVTSIPVAIFIIVAAPFVLKIWLGSEFVDISSDAMRILAVGFVFSAFAQVPYTRIQALGRPNWTALLHIAELAPFLVGAYALAQIYGVTGIAAAWALRNFIDLVALSSMARVMKIA